MYQTTKQQQQNGPVNYLLCVAIRLNSIWFKKVSYKCSQMYPCSWSHTCAFHAKSRCEAVAAQSLRWWWAPTWFGSSGAQLATVRTGCPSLTQLLKHTHFHFIGNAANLGVTFQIDRRKGNFHREHR